MEDSFKNGPGKTVIFKVVRTAMCNELQRYYIVYSTFDHQPNIWNHIRQSMFLMPTNEAWFYSDPDGCSQFDAQMMFYNIFQQFLPHNETARVEPPVAAAREAGSTKLVNTKKLKLDHFPPPAQAASLVLM